MGQSLFNEFCNECIADYADALLTGGIYGILEAFEVWLLSNNYLKNAQGSYEKWPAEHSKPQEEGVRQ